LLIARPSAAPSAIVLSLHGSTSTPHRQMLLSRMAALSDQGALVAFPQGSRPARSGWEWDLQADVIYLDAVVGHLRENFGAGTAPLCVNGMSGGARMASRYSCEGAAAVSVLGAVAGLRSPTPGRLAHRVRVLAFHGTRDRLNPYGGGSTARWRESVPAAAAAWAAANGHDQPPLQTTVTAALSRFSYGAGDDPGAVTLWVCEGAGHTWPGTRLGRLARMFLGRVSYEVDATREIALALADPSSGA
jgi:polyhydroxybutyrate depolymerase